MSEELTREELMKRVSEDALAMQDRFSAEPVYRRTGKGSLKSTGVAELQRIKALIKAKDGR